MQFTQAARQVLTGSILSLALVTAAIPQAKAADTLVNTYLTSRQQDSVVASDPAGNSVVTWQSFGQDGNGHGIYARRYNNAGVAVGSEFRVNTTTLYSQQHPAIAMDDSGRFAICWADNSDDSIRAQRFNADGSALGSEFRVDTPRYFSFLYEPAVAMSPSGAFVVVWKGQSNTYGSTYDIYGQRFAADGSPVGTEFMINSTTEGEQQEPSVALSSNGKFVVAWSHNLVAADGSWINPQVRTQLYDASGARVGDEYSISDVVGYEQHNGRVAMDDTGAYLVSWTGARAGAGGTDMENPEVEVYVQKFSATGTPLGNELRVNTTVEGYQLNRSIAMNASGDFVISWDGAEPPVSTEPANPDAPMNYDPYMQRFSADGVKQGPEVRLNSYTTGNQWQSWVSIDSSGKTAATWSSLGQGSSTWDVYFARFGTARPPVAVNDTATLNEDTSKSIPVLANDSDPESDALTITEVSGASHGTTSVITTEVGTTGLLYTPKANYHGPDSVTYTISDGNGGTASATVAITVEAVNDVPVAGGQDLSTAEDVSVSVSVQATDADGEPLAYSLTQAPTGGTLSGTLPNVVYTPNPNFYGSDSFSFKVNDGTADSNTATINVAVTPVNDAPLAVRDTSTTKKNRATSIPVLANDTDVDGDKLSISSVTAGANGTVARNGDFVIFTPKRNFIGNASFTYTISDGRGGTSAATVNVTVTK